MAELSAAPSINDLRSQSLLTLIERLGALDLVPLLVYRIDSVPESALPFLAWQFDVLSPFWQLVEPIPSGVDALTNIDLIVDVDNLIEADGVVPELLTHLSQRELLKIAIPLHRFRGTPFAVKRALSSLGWTDIDLMEGQDSWGGHTYPASQGWAVFRVGINLKEDQAVLGAAVIVATASINFFKPARALLDSIWFLLPITVDLMPLPQDRVTVDGDDRDQLDAAPTPHDVLVVAIVGVPLADAFGPIVPLYDGHYRHSGITYGANEPEVADSALELNGAAILHGG